MTPARKLMAVLTTVQKPTPCVLQLAQVLNRFGAHLIVVGDKKGPETFAVTGATFHSLADQLKLPYELVRLLPCCHYSRKNIGYLLAFSSGAKCIYETDDDNAPLDHWRPRTEQVKAQKAEPRPWLNVYRIFKDELIWPRGFPLIHVRNPETYKHDKDATLLACGAPIQQGLANNAPDVDAVWRLLLDRHLDFCQGPSIWLPAHTYCPFNSQSTWWRPDAYPLMYLPTYCSFRMTDIWRSFVAQRCLWAFGGGLVFHGPEVYQMRNTHSLSRDFEDEVPGYLANSRITELLDGCTLLPGREHVGENLRICYEALVKAAILPPEEMKLVDAWLADVATHFSRRREPSMAACP